MAALHVGKDLFDLSSTYLHCLAVVFDQPCEVGGDFFADRHAHPHVSQVHGGLGLMIAAGNLQSALHGHISKLGDGLGNLQIGSVTRHGHGIGAIGDEATQLGQHLGQ
ncbi:hypothetical protein D3C85_1699060 [compost metagenome]